MAMNMRCRDQSWSGRAVDCFDIGIECGREIHGENEVLLKFKFCEGNGDISLWNEVWRDDGWWWWCDEVCVGEWNFVRGRGVCVHVGRFVWGLVWCREVLCFLYNSNFMWWTTNYLYEMKLDECDAVISSTHSYHPIIQILWDEWPTISIWYHFQQWCLHHLSTPILSDFAPIQIPWGSYTYVPC